MSMCFQTLGDVTNHTRRRRRSKDLDCQVAHEQRQNVSRSAVTMKKKVSKLQGDGVNSHTCQCDDILVRSVSSNAVKVTRDKQNKNKFTL